MAGFCCICDPRALPSVMALPWEPPDRPPTRFTRPSTAHLFYRTLPCNIPTNKKLCSHMFSHQHKLLTHLLCIYFFLGKFYTRFTRPSTAHLLILYITFARRILTYWNHKLCHASTVRLLFSWYFLHPCSYIIVKLHVAVSFVDIYSIIPPGLYQ